jgi:hypothetical protein
VIVKKPQFHAEGGSDKHLRDIASIVRISGSEIDRDYVTEWGGFAVCGWKLFVGVAGSK